MEILHVAREEKPGPWPLTFKQWFMVTGEDRTVHFVQVTEQQRTGATGAFPVDVRKVEPDEVPHVAVADTVFLIEPPAPCPMAYATLLARFELEDSRDPVAHGFHCTSTVSNDALAHTLEYAWEGGLLAESKLLDLRPPPRLIYRHKPGAILPKIDYIVSGGSASLELPDGVRATLDRDAIVRGLSRMIREEPSMFSWVQRKVLNASAADTLIRFALISERAP